VGIIALLLTVLRVHLLAATSMLRMGSGRMFQTDNVFEQMAMAPNGSLKEWQDFSARILGGRLFFDYTIKA
jgi:hypothetical protein